MSTHGLFAAFIAIVLVLGSWVVGCALAGRAVDPTPHLILLALLALSTQLSSLLRELRGVREAMASRVQAGASDQARPANAEAGPTRQNETLETAGAVNHGGQLTLQGHWMQRRVRLPRAVRTPLGSEATSATIRVDVAFEVADSGRIEVRSAQLSRPGDGSRDQRDRFNAMTATGERFCLDAEFDGAALAKAVAQELDMGDGSLARELASRWRRAQAANDATA